MELTDVFVGAEVEHVRDPIRGLVTRVIEQPEPAPVHVDVLTVASGTFTLPINQLRLVPLAREAIQYGQPLPIPRPVG